jgi:hypothetical protein
MAVKGIRLFPIGLIVLSTALAGAQTKLVNAAADVTPPPAPAPAPEVPKRPAEMSPKPPKVTCRGDQISISADNSTLDAILAAVKGCTGAKIDIPNGAGAIRAFEDLGPGPVREVLDDLLSGTQYNYVIQSSAANPLKVEMVMMTMRTHDANAPAPDLIMTGGRKAWSHMQKFDKPDPNNPDKPMDETESPAAEPTAPSDPVADANAGKTPEAAPEAVPAAVTAAINNPIAPPVVDPGSAVDPSKAIEDRINSMQQLFNQRQQMMQKQGQTQPTTPNN